MFANVRSTVLGMDNVDRMPRRIDHEPDAVAYARRQAGLSQAALARQIGVGRSLINEIEAGTRNATPHMLRRLAQALNCPVVVLERKRQVSA